MSSNFLTRLARAEKRDEAQLYLTPVYKVIGPISSGSFSSVVRAKRLVDGLCVAVKIFKRTEEAIASYQTEATMYTTIFHN